MDFEGENISLTDALFVDHVTGDMETWRIKSEAIERVLVFPPVNNYHRFLIHKVVETGFPELTTFSVCEAEERRTVVCFQQQLLDYTLGNIRWEKARDTGEFLDDGVMVQSDLIDHERLDTNFLIDAAKDTSKCIADHDSNNCDVSINIPSVSVSPETCQDVSSTDSSPAGTPSKQKKTSTSKSRQKKRPERAVYVPPMGRGKPLSANASEFKPNSPGHVLAAEAPGHVSVVGRDVTDQVVTEITTALGGVQIESPAVDYSSFQTSDSTINIDQFGHVIELYDFPQEMKTNDLMAAFSAFTSRWDIKWVDDTHALGVFSSSEVAAEALALRHPQIKSRPLNMATAQSKCKARAVCEYLLPYKPRPATSTAPARRLIQWALGSDKKVPAASKVEQDRLREAIKRKEEDKRKRREEMISEKRNKYSDHDDR